MEYILCPKKHHVPYCIDNLARDFSSGDKDLLTNQPMYELGFFCFDCNKIYALNKLEEIKPKNN